MLFKGKRNRKAGRNMPTDRMACRHCGSKNTRQFAITSLYRGGILGGSATMMRGVTCLDCGKRDLFIYA